MGLLLPVAQSSHSKPVHRRMDTRGCLTPVASRAPRHPAPPAGHVHSVPSGVLSLPSPPHLVLPTPLPRCLCAGSKPVVAPVFPTSSRVSARPLASLSLGGPVPFCFPRAPRFATATRHTSVTFMFAPTVPVKRCFVFCVCLCRWGDMIKCLSALYEKGAVRLGRPHNGAVIYLRDGF